MEKHSLTAFGQTSFLVLPKVQSCLDYDLEISVRQLMRPKAESPVTSWKSKAQNEIALVEFSVVSVAFLITEKMKKIFYQN